MLMLSSLGDLLLSRGFAGEHRWLTQVKTLQLQA